MRILIVNTSERIGGAAVAANRLVAALNSNGEKAMMLVRDKSSGSISVGVVRRRWLMRLRFLWERAVVFAHLGFRRQHLWEVDIANVGVDITGMKEFREADVIHLSWVNQGMLSLRGIRAILRSGKPVVWTMHDMWPATSICHYAGECRQFMSSCRHCPLLPNGGGEHDLSSRVWRRKKRVYSTGDIHFVACSRWLESQARQSALLTGMPLTSIPNPIDTHIYFPQDKAKSKAMLGIPADRLVIMFVAHKVTDERKGANYLVDALMKLRIVYRDVADRCVVALIGACADELTEKIALPVVPVGFVNGDSNLARVYSAADVFVLPSVEDNLPNTVMEAMACGAPCVGFDVGGIPEMIDHRLNGYVAVKGDAEDLAEGIRWVLDDADYASLSSAAVDKVARQYSQTSVAMRYVDVYAEAMAKKRYLR